MLEGNELLWQCRRYCSQHVPSSENVARTSVLGALFGAAYGDNAADKDRWTELCGQLYYHKELTSEINAMLSIKKKE